jgi:hypothetical protein
MLLFSIAHFYCFPTDEWEENYKADYNKGKFGDSMAFGDFVADLKLILRSNPSNKRKKKKKALAEATILEGDEQDDTENEETASYDETEEDRSSVISDITSGIDEEDPKMALARSIAEKIEDWDASTAEEHEGENDVEHEGEHDVEEMDEATQNLLDRLSFFSDRGPQSVPTTQEPKEGDPQHDDTEQHEGEHDLEQQEQAANERTGLLSGQESPPPIYQTEYEVPLRPSIFTTVAQLASAEKAKKKRDKGEEQ